jgi:hypothetical protein
MYMYVRAYTYIYTYIHKCSDFVIGAWSADILVVEEDGQTYYEDNICICMCVYIHTHIYIHTYIVISSSGHGVLISLWSTKTDGLTTKMIKAKRTLYMDAEMGFLM